MKRFWNWVRDETNVYDSGWISPAQGIDCIVPGQQPVYMVASHYHGGCLHPRTLFQGWQLCPAWVRQLVAVSHDVDSAITTKRGFFSCVISPSI